MQEKAHHSDDHKKNDFLIERIAFFSDAVFAIAITLMILEIHPPLVGKNDSSAKVWRELLDQLPEFIGLMVSFWLIGSAWLRHHQLFKYVAKYDMRFKSINLALLFTIILFPYSTSFLFKSLFANVVTKPQVIFYLGVPLFSNFILFIMFRQVRNKHLIGKGDEDLHKAIFDLGMMMLSFVLALTWVIVCPIEMHPYGYIFLGAGWVLGPVFRRKR